MSLVEHARREIKLAELDLPSSDYNGMIGKAVIELVEAFAKQGHSGFSAAWTKQLFEKLTSFENLTELTNDPAEWTDVSEQTGSPLWQSKRRSDAFSFDGGVNYYILEESREQRMDEDGYTYSTYRDEKTMHRSKDVRSNSELASSRSIKEVDNDRTS